MMKLLRRPGERGGPAVVFRNTEFVSPMHSMSGRQEIA